MDLIFYGFLALTFRIINQPGLPVGTLLAIGGYFLIFKGIEKAGPDNPHFRKNKELLIALMVINGIAFLTGFGRANAGGLLLLVAFVIDIIVMLNLFKGIALYSEKLEDKNLPTKLFKRWRMTYILWGIMALLSLIMFFVIVASLPWTDMPDILAQIQAVGTNNVREILTLFWNLLIPVMSMVILWIVLSGLLALTILVFHILFLVTMYQIQSQVQRAELNQSLNPTDLQ